MTPEIQRHIWVMKFLTFTSQLTLPTVELISEPSNLIRRCWGKVARRQSNHSLSVCVSLSISVSLPLFALDQEQKQVWERACESGTGGVLANPSPLIAADASMLALLAVFHNSWCLARGFFMFV